MSFIWESQRRWAWLCKHATGISLHAQPPIFPPYEQLWPFVYRLARFGLFSPDPEVFPGFIWRRYCLVESATREGGVGDGDGGGWRF